MIVCFVKGKSALGDIEETTGAPAIDWFELVLVLFVVVLLLLFCPLTAFFTAFSAFCSALLTTCCHQGGFDCAEASGPMQ